MSINSISNNSVVDAVSQWLESKKATQPTASVGAVPQDSSTISQGASLMSQLQQLQQSNPSEFKQVAAQIASNLDTAAGQQTGSSAQSLQQLATQFQQASQTGQMPGSASSSGAAGMHRHHHHHGGGGYDVADSSSSTDPNSIESIIQNALRTALSGSASTVTSTT